MENKINELKTFIYFFSRFRGVTVLTDVMYNLNTMVLYVMVVLLPVYPSFLLALTGISLTYLAILGLFVLSPQYSSYKEELKNAK